MGRYLRSLGAALCAATMLVSLGQSADAGREWCEDDPLFVVNGNQFRLTTGFSSAYLSSVSSIAYVLDVPADANVTVASPGKQAAAETVTVSRSLPAAGRSGFSVVAHVTVNAAASFATVTTVGGPTQSGSYDGSSNITNDITLSFAKANITDDSTLALGN